MCSVRLHYFPDLRSIPILLASCQQTRMTYTIAVCTVKNLESCILLVISTELNH